MALSNQEIRERIAELEELLHSGVSSVSADGTSTTFDLDSVRKELRSLRAQLPEHRTRRPTASRINLGGF